MNSMQKIKTGLLISMPTIILLGLFFLLKPNNKEINQEIKNLKEQNKILYNRNDSIFYQIQAIEKEKEKSEKRIKEIENLEELQRKRLQDLNVEIKNLKKKYEKANNHAANFSSADIQRYFADSLELR